MIWEHDQKGAEAGEQSWGDQLPTLILRLWEHALRMIIGKGRLPTKTKAVKQEVTKQIMSLCSNASFLASP